MTFPAFTRDEHGIPYIEADEEAALFLGQGMAHGTDRALQMLLMRLVGQGRVSEVLEASDKTLRVDTFFRRANWLANTDTSLGALGKREQALLQAYCDGVNHALARRVPWEFKLCRYRPEPWQPADTLLLLRMMGYLTLAASQGEMERLFIEMAQAGVAEEKLHELFPGILGGLDLPLLRQVKLGERILPADLWNVALPRMIASNNWVVAGHKSASGKPLLANDPHLEGNCLPAVWCEMQLRCNNRYLIGGTVPGTPGVLSGRNNDLAWGATYAFMDAEDSWAEKCRDGKFYREEDNQWIGFRQRTETIRRKHKPPITLEFFENDHGVLDGDPRLEGHYLVTRWAAADAGAGAVTAGLGLLHTATVEAAMKLLGAVETAWNFVLADRQGNIGYQMSGRLPRRREGVSGFVPLPGWRRENDWQGFTPLGELPRLVNPPEGFFATANDDLNRFGRSTPINLPMGPYRADRIRQLLAARNNFTVADMRAMHFDVYSRQADTFMQILRPLLSFSPAAETLRHWDLQYSAESEGACLFERFYEQLYREVFGKGGLSESVVDALRQQTGAFIDFYHNFDRVLLAEHSAWFGGRSREQIFRQAAEVSLHVPPKRWGEVHRFEMTNIFFGGKLQSFLGFDRGPFAAIGNRATIHQAQLYTSGGRRTSFLPSFRIATDLATDEVYTHVAGGPSDRRFSQWYASDVENWLSGRYKTLSAHRGAQD